MRVLAPIVVLGLTSAGAYVACARVLRRAELSRAAMDVMETLGLAVVFLVGNLAVGTGAILVFRALTGYFISIYVVSDAVLAVCSLIQALLFQRWRERSG